MTTKIGQVLACLVLCGATLAQAQNVMTIVSGDKQSVQRSGEQVPGGIANFGPMSVVVKDKAGKPVPGVRVNFQCGPKPNAMACQMDDRSSVGNTDANGVRTLNSVRAYYASGKMPIVVSGDNTTQVTFDLTVLDAAPPAAAVAGATLAIVSGDGQKVARGATASGIPTARFAPLQVSVKDGAGKPIANARVVFECGSKPQGLACQTEPSGAGGATVYTDANGIATANKMGGNSATAYYADGPFTIVAKYGNANATFKLAVDPAAGGMAAGGGANVMTIVSGDKQSVQRSGEQVPGGIANFGALSVVVKDKAGKPVPGVRVNFQCGPKPNAMACQMDDNSSVGNTDANGVRTLKSVRAYYASGKMPIVVSGDNTSQVTFDLTVLDAAPPAAAVAGATLAIVSGDGQKVARTPTASGIPTARFAPLQVSVKDGAGKPIANARVVFDCGSKPQGLACQTEPSGAGGAAVYTDANGIATANKMGGSSATAYYADGPFTIVAKYGTANATFKLTAGQ